MHINSRWPVPPPAFPPPMLPAKRIEDCAVLHVIHKLPFIGVPVPSGHLFVGLAEPGPDVATPGTPTHQMLCARADGLFMANSDELVASPMAYAVDQVFVGDRWHRVYVACLAVSPARGERLQ